MSAACSRRKWKSMPATGQSPKGNRLLQALPPTDWDLVAPHLTVIPLNLRYTLERPNRRIEEVCFPKTGIASMVAEKPNGRRIEIGLLSVRGLAKRRFNPI